MVHQLLNDLLEAVSVFGLVGGAVIVLFWVAERVERVWQYLRRNSRLDYERYHAEQSIRSIKRNAILEMLTAEREHRNLGGNGEVIESTAVEVRQ